MSRVERKEYQETRVMKSLSPVRQGSAQNASQFDNNLDYLLEDLQSSVPRSNGTTNTYRETRVNRNVDPDRSRSLNRVTHLKAANPTTEYSSDDAYNYTSPDGSKSVKGFKKETYSYSTSGDNKNRMQNNINQLDSLLDDLKQVKNQGSNNNVGIDPGLIEPTRSKVVMGKRTVERELHYGDTPPRSNSRTRTLERGDPESITRQIEYVDEGTYGETRPIRYTPSPQPQSTLTKHKQVTNVHTYPVEVSETTTPDINPDILANLDPNLLPGGNTKVTTTIKTYTYEIPGSGFAPVGNAQESEKLVYSPNQTQTTPSKSFVYNKVESNDVTNYVSSPPPQQNYQTNIYKETSSVHHNAPPYQKPSPPAGSTTRVVKETTRNYQPPYQSYPDSSPPGKQTYIYNESTTTKTIDENYPREPQYIQEVPRREPPRNETYVIRESHNTTNTTAGSPYPYRPNDYPPQEPGRTTIIYKQDTHTTNTTGSPYSPPHHQNEPDGYPPQEPGPTTVIYKHDTRHTNNYTSPPRQQNPPNTTVIYKTETNTENYNNYPPHGGRPEDYPRSGPRYPNEQPYNPNNVNITYKYTTHSTSSNNYKDGYPPNDESLPLTRPQPFPRDDGTEGPPKRVDQLMASIGDEPPDSPLNQGFAAHEVDLARQKKVDALKQQQQQREVEDLQKKEKNLPPSRNITGPPVYYPPGHEMFARKEESGGGGWRAEGAMAKESGRYMYESESGSKMKVKSGAAVVPVCLPLCCGLPCTII